MPTYRYRGRSFRSQVALSPEELDHVFQQMLEQDVGTLPVEAAPFQARAQAQAAGQPGGAMVGTPLMAPLVAAGAAQQEALGRLWPPPTASKVMEHPLGTGLDYLDALVTAGLGGIPQGVGQAAAQAAGALGAPPGGQEAARLAGRTATEMAMPVAGIVKARGPLEATRLPPGFVGPARQPIPAQAFVPPAAAQATQAAPPTPRPPTAVQGELPLTRDLPLQPAGPYLRDIDPATGLQRVDELGRPQTLPRPTGPTRVPGEPEFVPERAWEGGATGRYERPLQEVTQPELPLTRATPMGPSLKETAREGVAAMDQEQAAALQRFLAEQEVQAAARAERAARKAARKKGKGPLTQEELAQEFQTYAPDPTEAATPGRWTQLKTGLKEAPTRLRVAARLLTPSQFSVLRNAKNVVARWLGGVIQREATGAAYTEAKLLDEINQTIRPLIKTKRDNVAVFNFLNQEAVEGLLATQPARVRQAVANGRALLDRLADEMGLGRGQRLEYYIHHTFNRDELRLQVQEMIAQAQQTGNTANAKQLTDLLIRLNRGGLPRFPQLPEEVKVSFLQQRQGMPGYSRDTLEALERYVNQWTRKTHGDRMLQAFDEATRQNLPPDLADFANFMIDRYVGLKDPTRALGPAGAKAAADVDRWLRRLQFVDKLFLNPKWAFGVNLPSGQIYAAARVGVSGVRGAMTLARYPEARDAFLRSGHSHSTFLRDILSRVGRRAPRTDEWLSLGAGRIETMNRGAAWLGEIYNQLARRKFTVKQMREALRDGVVPDEVMQAADDAVRETQGLFGLDNPMWFEIPGVKAAFQFGAVPAKLAQTTVTWARNPRMWPALASLMVMSEIFEEGVKQAGVDVSRAHGVGLDLDRVIKGYATGDANLIMEGFLAPIKEGRMGLWSIAWGGPAMELFTKLPKGVRAVVETFEGEPRAYERMFEGIPGGISSALARGKRAYETATTGGDPYEIVRQLANLELPISAARDIVLDKIESGDEEAALQFKIRWERKHGQVISITPDALRARQQRRATREEEREKFQADLGDEARYRRALTPRERRVLGP